MTQRLSVEDMEQAVQLLEQGDLVAFETETVYGLGANAKDQEAIEKIYQAKERPKDQALIVLISNRDQLELLVEEVPETAEKLMEAYWPGPLTLIFKAKPGALAANVTAGQGTVAVRYTSSPVAQDLINRLGQPIAAPSANKTGHLTPLTADHVLEDLDGEIAAVLDSGPAEGGIESTLVDVSKAKAKIMRSGAISHEEIVRVIGPVALNRQLVSDMRKNREEFPKVTHYAKTLPVVVVSLNGIGFQAAIDKYQAEGEKIALLANDDIINRFRDEAEAVYSIGAHGDYSAAARSLYAGLRELSASDATIILAEALPLLDLGEAYMNRLTRAADGHMV